MLKQLAVLPCQDSGRCATTLATGCKNLLHLAALRWGGTSVACRGVCRGEPAGFQVTSWQSACDRLGTSCGHSSCPSVHRIWGVVSKVSRISWVCVRTAPEFENALPPWTPLRSTHIFVKVRAFRCALETHASGPPILLDTAESGRWASFGMAFPSTRAPRQQSHRPSGVSANQLRANTKSRSVVRPEASRHAGLCIALIGGAVTVDPCSPSATMMGPEARH